MSVTDAQLKDVAKHLKDNEAWVEVLRRVSIKNFSEFRSATTLEEQQKAAAKQNCLDDIAQEINVIFDTYLEIE